MITGLSHVSIVVPDLAAAAERLSKLFGLTVGETSGQRAARREARVRRARQCADRADGSRRGPTRRSRASSSAIPNGGIHHFCLGVDSVDATASALQAGGARVLGDGKPQVNVHGERIAFVHPKDFLGALVELEEHSERDE